MSPEKHFLFKIDNKASIQSNLKKKQTLKSTTRVQYKVSNSIVLTDWLAKDNS